jgi:hypothetical protein
MKLSEFKSQLSNVEELNFLLPSGSFVPKHFHITEAGLTTKHFIDCGGTVRTEKVISFQLWTANDIDHRLQPDKLLKIIALSENIISGEDLEIEAEYQGETIGRYGVEFMNNTFLLTFKQTNCLAQDQCGIPPAKKRISLNELNAANNSCTPGGGCC